MKENKLTIEDAMKYPKARIVDYEYDKRFAEDNNGQMIPIYHDNILDYLAEVDCEHWENMIDCKLILRSKDNMTEDEKLKELNFFHPQKAMGVGIGMNELWQSHLKGFDYLRSISVDIDGFEKQGIAVYESEGKQ